MKFTVNNRTYFVFIWALILFSCSDDGLDGFSSLVNFSDEPQGENCANGGIKVETGIDKNSNGLLEPEEVQDVSYVCDGASLIDEGQSILVITGAISNEEAQAKVNSAVGANTQVIIIKNTNQLTKLEIPNVEHLTEIQIEGNRALGTVEFSNLLQVDDRIAIVNNNSDSLNINMNALIEVRGNVEFSNNNSIQMGLSSLEKVFWIRILNENGIDLQLPQLNQALVLEVSDSAGNFVIDLPELSTLGDLYFNKNLVANLLLSAPKLQQLVLVEIQENEAIGASVEFNEVVDLSGLTEIGLLLFSGNNLFTTFDLPDIQRISTIEIVSNDRLRSVAMERLSATSNIAISSNDAVETINLVNLQDMGFRFSIALNPFLTDLTIDAISTTTASFFSLNGNAFSSETVNYILSQFVNISPALTGITLQLQQTPAAAPTGQGLIDKVTLENNGNTVNTD